MMLEDIIGSSPVRTALQSDSDSIKNQNRFYYIYSKNKRNSYSPRVYFTFYPESILEISL